MAGQGCWLRQQVKCPPVGTGWIHQGTAISVAPTARKGWRWSLLADVRRSRSSFTRQLWSPAPRWAFKGQQIRQSWAFASLSSVPGRLCLVTQPQPKCHLLRAASQSKRAPLSRHNPGLVIGTALYVPIYLLVCSLPPPPPAPGEQGSCLFLLLYSWNLKWCPVESRGSKSTCQRDKRNWDVLNKTEQKFFNRAGWKIHQSYLIYIIQLLTKKQLGIQRLF